MPRACDVLDLYERVAKGRLAPGEVVFSADEKTSIQARQHATHTPTGAGEPAHVQHTYARRGAVNLIASLNVATGTVFGKVSARKTFREFADFLVALITDAVEHGKHTIHLILDNGSTHRPKYLETWLSENFPHVNVIVHWLPVRSSWLNQIEIFFGILQAQALTPNNFPSTVAAAERILGYIDFYNQGAHPIAWTYTSTDLQRKYGVSEVISLPNSETQGLQRGADNPPAC